MFTYAPPLEFGEVDSLRALPWRLQKTIPAFPWKLHKVIDEGMQLLRSNPGMKNGDILAKQAPYAELIRLLGVAIIYVADNLQQQKAALPVLPKMPNEQSLRIAEMDKRLSNLSTDFDWLRERGLSDQVDDGRVSEELSEEKTSMQKLQGLIKALNELLLPVLTPLSTPDILEIKTEKITNRETISLLEIDTAFLYVLGVKSTPDLLVRLSDNNSKLQKELERIVKEVSDTTEYCVKNKKSGKLSFTEAGLRKMITLLCESTNPLIQQNIKQLQIRLARICIPSSPVLPKRRIHVYKPEMYAPVPGDDYQGKQQKEEARAAFLLYFEQEREKVRRANIRQTGHEPSSLPSPTQISQSLSHDSFPLSSNPTQTSPLPGRISGSSLSPTPISQSLHQTSFPPPPRSPSPPPVPTPLTGESQSLTLTAGTLGEEPQQQAPKDETGDKDDRKEEGPGA